MRIVLSGIETNNKGAELMLYAILQEIERKYPKADVYVPLWAISQGLDYVHTELNLKDKPFADFKRNKAPKLHIQGIMKRLHLPYQIVTDYWPVSHADYFLDASGFSLSDQWNPSEESVINLEQHLSSYYKQGSKIIYLPQAFGPIENTCTRKMALILNKYADIIMPREKVSYNYLLNAGVIESKLRIFTDFTSLVEGKCPEQYKKLIGGVCIIPNARMIDKGILTYDYYLKSLTKIIDFVKSQGRNVYILSHEISSDNPLCDQLAKSFRGDIDVITGLNAIEVKGVISTSYVCITSRFHGVASALNSMVPCLATSWSHKYAELFADYGQLNCVLNLKDIDTSISRIAYMLDEKNNSEIRKCLSNQVPKIKELTNRMWELVWSI